MTELMQVGHHKYVKVAKETKNPEENLCVSPIIRILEKFLQSISNHKI